MSDRATSATKKITELNAWINEVCQCKIVLGDTLADASSRSYHRTNYTDKQGRVYLAVNWPDDLMAKRTFKQVGNWLIEHQIKAPIVLACDEEHGFFIIEEFKLAQAHDLLHADQQNLHNIDTVILQTLAKIAKLPAPDFLSPYDQEKITAEYMLFIHWYCKHQSFLPNEEELTYFTGKLQSILCDAFVDANACLVHRDYHSRNLLLSDDFSQLVLLDFQDALLGPPAYDLASYLLDAYYQRPFAQVEQEVTNYAKALNLDQEKFSQQFWLIATQRLLKVLGIFCRLSIRDHKHDYLTYLPLVREYLTYASQKAQLTQLHQMLMRMRMRMQT